MGALDVRSPEPVAGLVGADRAAFARAVLARAEERTGAGRRVVLAGQQQPTGPAAPASDRLVDLALVTGAVTPVSPPNPTAGQGTPPEIDPEAATRFLPVHSGVAGLLPSGALDRGTTVVVDGSTSLVLALIAAASQAGAWAAVVGLPEVGVLAAHQLGLVLDRVALVPSPGPDAPSVVAALIDGVDIVVLGPGVALGPADRRRLAARARERSAVLIPTAPWPGAHVVLTAEASRWEGLGRGHGRLRSRRLTVHRAGRGSATRPMRTEVVLPEAPAPWGGAVAPVAPGRQVPVQEPVGPTAPQGERRRAG
ncbi:hypothetical protein [Actinotalea sp. K2]|uniref:hypothetical protein n=1 Tax=Actinotalea sp. K2 TaxID=2939438 RepID=UPI002017949D|nr:hypothetical protein [Actinotalea sp. K2]MCL3861929.1 hypothetical protein [Actinotalea sp. K2]